MKNQVSLICLLTFVIALSLSGVRAQEPPDTILSSDSIFASFAGSIANLRSRLPPNFSEAYNQVHPIDRSVSFLQQQINSHDLYPVPDQYLKSLALDADMLKTVADRNRPASSAERSSLLEVLQLIASDLAIKVAHLEHHNKGPALVEVTVRARTGGSEADDYEVWYVPKGWSNYSNAYKKFDQLTNHSLPPKMFLAPGNYVIWLSRPPSKTEPRPVTIGGDGRARRDIELLIPNRR
jgi:hypothetical protein